MSFEVIEGKNVTDKDIYQALMLDRLVYDEIYFIGYEQCLRWNKANNRIYTMIKDTDTGKIATYVNISPVTEEFYDKIRGGYFIDATLPASAVVSYDIPGLYDLYFSSVVIHPDYRNTGLFRPLLEAITDKFVKLANEGIYVRRMVADAVSDNGIRFCKMFGMSEVKSSAHNSKYMKFPYPAGIQGNIKGGERAVEIYKSYPVVG